MPIDSLIPLSAADSAPITLDPLLKQARISLVSECAAIAVSLCAVYAAEGIFPEHMEAASATLARQLGRWKNTPGAVQEPLARRLTDAAVMNIGGVANMGLQFALHRQEQPKEERLPLAQEAGRLLSGRAAGTLGAFTALALASPHLPTAQASDTASASKRRFTELVTNNAIQSLGALAGNIPAQVLYDRLVSRFERTR